jgi:hypothetical protein
MSPSPPPTDFQPCCSQAAFSLTMFRLVSVLCFLELSFAAGQLAQPIGSPFLVAQNPAAVVSQVLVDQAVQGAAVAGAAKESEFQETAGPWGTLTSYPFFLEAPESLVSTFPLPSTQTRWAFASEFKASIGPFLLECGLGQAEVDAILKEHPPVDEAPYCYAFPPLPIMDGLSAAVRAKIYQKLRQYPPNEYHVDPVLIYTGDVEGWFESSGLAAPLKALVKRYAYLRDSCLAFSDLPALMAQCNGEAQMREVMKALTRTRSLMVSVKLTQGMDVTAMMNYWTTGLNTRRKDLESMVQSICASRREAEVDVNHFLAALPRKLLFTYPDTSMLKEGILPDCHWSSLNFFNYESQSYLLDSRMATSAVLERFSPVEAPFKYGDILFLLDAKTGDAFHSCVYIADDIVFTKNGRNVVSPWVMMKISDVSRIYLHDGNGRLQAYRNKQAPAFPLSDKQ